MSGSHHADNIYSMKNNNHGPACSQMKVCHILILFSFAEMPVDKGMFRVTPMTSCNTSI